MIEIKAPDRDGKSEDVVMEYEKLEDYLSYGKNGFGSTIGLVATVIKCGEFCMRGKYYRVGKNSMKKHCVNGGRNGFSRLNWEAFVDGTDVVLSKVTDESNGFPGIVLVQDLFSVNAKNTLTIKATARTNQVTPLDISNRLFFNLANHGSGSSELKNHLVTVNASRVLKKNSEGLFNNFSMDADSTAFDLRSRKNQLLEDLKETSIDCLFIVNGKTEEAPQFVSIIIHPPSGRVLEILSNQ